MPDVLVNETASHTPPAIARNGGSDFVVVWTEVGGVAIRARIIPASGEPTNQREFAVGGTEEGEQSFPAVAAGGPGFGVAWLVDRPPCSLALQRFGSDGTKRDGRIQLNATDVDCGHAPAIASLPDLSFVVTWVSANFDEGIRARIIRPDGTPEGPDFQVNTSDGVHSGPLGLSALPDNSFVVAWQGGPNLASRRPQLQILNPDGSKVGSEKRPNFVGFTGDIAIAPTIDPRPTGQPARFAMARTTETGGREERLVIGTGFTHDGDVLVEFNITQLNDQSIASDVAIAPLPNGSSVVAWTDRKVPHVGDTTGDNIKAILCGATQGSLLSSTVQVNSTTGGDQRCPAVAVRMDDLGHTQIAFAWIDDSVSGATSPNRAVQSRVFTGDLRPMLSTG